MTAPQSPFTGSETLLPCPFCGCDGQKFKDFWDSGTIDCFGCKDCAISFECADEWNRREPQSVTVAQAAPETIDSVPSCGQENDYRRAQRPTEPDLMPAVAQTLRFFKAKIEERGGWSPVCQARFDEAHAVVSTHPSQYGGMGEAKPFLWICLVPNAWDSSKENIRAWTPDPDRAAQLKADGLNMQPLFAAPQPPANAYAGSDPATAQAVRLRYAILGYLEVFDRCGGSESVSPDAFAAARQGLREAVAMTSTLLCTPTGEDCAHRIAVTPRNGAPHGAGFACGLSGGHCQPKEGCGYVAHSSTQSGGEA